MDDTPTRQIYELAQLRLMMTAATLQTLLRKANFNPDQPSVPAGEPGGGRWTDVLSASYRTTDYDANSYVNDTLRANASTVKLVADGLLGQDTVFLKLRRLRRKFIRGVRCDAQSRHAVTRKALELMFDPEHGPSDPKSFVVITAYPRSEEPMTLKSAKPPQAFVDFAERMFQDAEFFETLEDLLRFGLQGIPRDRLGDFTAFVKRIENHEIGDRDLERLWHGSGADVGYPAPGLRIFLHRARELAEREGPDGSLYKTRPKWSSTPTSKDLL